MSTDGMPEFDHPPVVETVLSARFRESARLTTARLVQFWEKHLAEDFPDVAEQPPYAAPVEPAGELPSIPSFLRLEAMLPSPRFWFSKGSELVQLQGDWIAFNWRQTEDQGEYLRYAHTRARFATLLETFESFVTSVGGSFEPVQVEVTYVNQVRLEPSDVEAGPFGRVFKDVVPGAGAFLPSPELARFATSYQIRVAGSTQLGRLHLQADSALLASGDRSPAVTLNLTARGRPESPTRAGVLQFCDLGRRWVVEGFKDVTSDSMHIRWGLKGGKS